MNINKINPATLKITDMRFADIDGAPKRCTLLKLYTNQGIVGYGEVRENAVGVFDPYERSVSYMVCPEGA